MRILLQSEHVQTHKEEGERIKGLNWPFILAKNRLTCIAYSCIMYAYSQLWIIMKDARGMEVSIGDSVVFHQKQHTDFRIPWNIISWGTIVKINKQMIRVEDHNGIESSKYPENTVVVYFP